MTCSACGYRKPLDQFNKHHGQKCLDCRRAYQRQWRKANPEAARRHAQPSIGRRRDRNRQWVWAYKLANPCAGTLTGPCPYGATDPRVLEFDHIGDDKTANVSTLVFNAAALKTVQAEVAKCVVRCRNCHSIVTFERNGNYTNRM